MNRRVFLHTMLLAVPAAGQIVPYTYSDPTLYRAGAHTLPNADSYDDMETYSVAAEVNGLNGGTNWFSAYTDNYPYFGVGTGDDMESYSASANLDGLNGGTTWFLFWGSAYTSNDFTVQDDMESYTAAAALNGLNGGAASSPFWGGAYVDR